MNEILEREKKSDSTQTLDEEKREEWRKQEMRDSIIQGSLAIVICILLIVGVCWLFIGNGFYLLMGQ